MTSETVTDKIKRVYDLYKWMPFKEKTRLENALFVLFLIGAGLLAIFWGLLPTLLATVSLASSICVFVVVRTIHKNIVKPLLKR